MDCVGFLQWALPRMGMRWKGFRKVRRQVCRRIRRRMAGLGVEGEPGYRAYLEAHPEEWEVLRRLCRVTISRFRRDRGVWQALEEEVLPELARLASSSPESASGHTRLRTWSAGCASGEEPYTLSLVWKLRLEKRFPGIRLQILATDVDRTVLERARAGVYEASSLKELDPESLQAGFTEVEERYRVRDPIREPVEFRRADLLRDLPPGPFHLILCRNLLLTYFDQATAARNLERILDRLVVGGALVVGSHENLPSSRSWPLVPWVESEPIFRKTD